MAAPQIPPPPPRDNERFDSWVTLLWKRLVDGWLSIGLTGTPNTVAGFGAAGESIELTRTGTGTVVAMQTSPALVTPDIGVASGTSLALGGGTALATTNRTGTGNLVLATSPTLTTPNIGAATGASLAATAAITSSGATAGVGYATGAGGTVVQATNKATGVTLNKICGQITMNGAALAAATAVSFVVTNSAVATTDVPVVAIDSVGTPGSYLVSVAAVGAGSFTITLYNCSAGSLSEAVVINFAVVKAVAA